MKDYEPQKSPGFPFVEEKKGSPGIFAVFFLLLSGAQAVWNVYTSFVKFLVPAADEPPAVKIKASGIFFYKGRTQKFINTDEILLVF